MKVKFFFVMLVSIFLVVLFAQWQPAAAARNAIYLVEPKTIELGKQGLYINDVPQNVYFVEIEKIKPPLLPKYTIGEDISYRGPVMDITFMNQYMAEVTPIGTLSSVFFNIGEPELKLWQAGGTSQIGIWYYNKNADEWQLCPTRLIAKNLDNNDKYDRLACFIMGNGFYLLGKMEFDKKFPELFKPYDKGETTLSNVFTIQFE